jgi:hypothetical protein
MAKNVCGDCKYFVEGQSVFGHFIGKCRLHDCSTPSVTGACGDFRAKGCFITTSVCLTLGQKDDCEELTAFRLFRDGFMSETPQMRKEVDEYYEIAPKICEAIDRTGPDVAFDIYTGIWSSSLKPTYEALLAGEKKKAHDIYRNMVLELKENYLQ